MAAIGEWVRCAVVIAICTGISAGGAAAQQDNAPRLTVVGEGRVEVAPDMAVLTLGVQHDDPVATGALDAVAQAIEGVLAALQQGGVATRDVQTTGLSLSPIYPDRYDDNSQPRAPTRYRATSDLTVTIRDLSTLGAVIDAAANAGGNNFGGIRFALSDPRTHRDAARRAAVFDARTKAELFADAAGLSLGGVVEMDEMQGSSQPRPMMEASAMRAMPVAEGTLEIDANVRIVFRLISDG